jgi:hypothetical protein
VRQFLHLFGKELPVGRRVAKIRQLIDYRPTRFSRAANVAVASSPTTST